LTVFNSPQLVQRPAQRVKVSPQAVQAKAGGFLDMFNRGMGCRTSA
jgi:hypothetical protein